MVKNMKGGAVIIDMAAIMGGNCELTKVDEIVKKDGVKIIGYSNIASRVAQDASRLFSKNLYNLNIWKRKYEFTSIFEELLLSFDNMVFKMPGQD